MADYVLNIVAGEELLLNPTGSTIRLRNPGAAFGRQENPTSMQDMVWYALKQTEARNRGIGRHHTAITLVGDEVFAVHCGTTNPTLVNGVAVNSRLQLSVGDRVSMGTHGREFSFILDLLRPVGQSDDCS